MKVKTLSEELLNKNRKGRAVPKFCVYCKRKYTPQRSNQIQCLKKDCLPPKIRIFLLRLKEWNAPERVSTDYIISQLES